MSKAACDAKMRNEGRCRLCLRDKDVRPLTRHRLVPGHFGGRYVPVNVIALCRPCHDLVDHKRLSVRAPARRMLRASLWPMEVAHARRAPMTPQGRWSFEHAYPKPTRELIEERRQERALDAA